MYSQHGQFQATNMNVELGKKTNMSHEELRTGSCTALYMCLCTNTHTHIKHSISQETKPSYSMV